MEQPGDHPELQVKKHRPRLKNLSNRKEYSLALSFFCLLALIRHLFGSMSTYNSWPYYGWLAFYAIGVVIGILMAKSAEKARDKQRKPSKTLEN